ncbi:MAG: hypothetical protein IKX00_03385 [Bacilli bacterium]|nr:hypothetical protein [Bacilli bacterium]
MSNEFTKKDLKRIKIYYSYLLKINSNKIEQYLDCIDVSDLLILKSYIQHKKSDSSTNNIIKLEFLIVSIKNNIQKRMENSGPSRD